MDNGMTQERGREMASKGEGNRSGMIAEAMGKNSRSNARVNVPDEYAKAEWLVEDPPSASALKLLLLVIAACGDDLDGEKQFPMSLLREVPGFAYKNAAFLEAELRKLMKATVRTSARLNFMMGNLHRTSFGVIVADAGLFRTEADGPLEGFSIRLGETFKQMVRFGEHYAVLDSAAVLAMRSRHSVLLYQYLAFVLRARLIRSLELPLEDVRRIFALQQNEYPLFGRLKEKVLIPACAEISDLTEFKVTATPMLQGRKAIGVRFRWQSQSGEKPAGAAPAASAAKGGKAKEKPSTSRKPSASASASQAASDADVLAFHADRVKRRLPGVSSMTSSMVHRLLAAGLVSQADLRAANLPAC
jgi:hypothetical protein